MNVKQLLFSKKGRIGRKEFWLCSVPAFIIAVLWFIFFYRHLHLFGIIFDTLDRWFPPTPNNPPPVLMHLVGLLLFLPLLLLWLLIWFSPVIIAGIVVSNMFDKRWQDRDRPKSKWFSSLMIMLPLMIVSSYHNLERWVWISMILILIAAVLWILIELGLLRGTVGDNKFGPDPLLPAMPSGNKTEREINP